MPCDAACIKHILNGGFMAALAPLLEGPEASALAAAAKAHNAMLAVMGRTITNEEQFDRFRGCEQAQALVLWITGKEVPDPDKMNEWTAELWRQIADLADGKLP